MFEFISNSPPETTLWLGLSVGALAADTIERILRHRLKSVSGVDD